MNYRDSANEQLRKMAETFEDAGKKRGVITNQALAIILVSVLSMALQAIACAILSLKWDIQE